MTVLPKHPNFENRWKFWQFIVHSEWTTFFSCSTSNRSLYKATPSLFSLHRNLRYHSLIIIPKILIGHGNFGVWFCWSICDEEAIQGKNEKSTRRRGTEKHPHEYSYKQNGFKGQNIKWVLFMGLQEATRENFSHIGLQRHRMKKPIHDWRWAFRIGQ